MIDVCTECGETFDSSSERMAHMWGALTPPRHRGSKCPCGRSYRNADDLGAPQDADAEFV